MPALTARREKRSTNIWPGFVDALATLLLVIIFLLMIFVLAQFFLNQAISGRDEALRKLETEITDLSNILALEKKTNNSLVKNLTNLSAELQASVASRDQLSQNLTDLQIASDNTDKKLERAMATILNQEEALKKSIEIGASRTKLIEKQKIELKSHLIDINNLQTLKTNLTNEMKTLKFQLDDSRTENMVLLEKEKRLSKKSQAHLSLLNQQLSALREQLTALAEALELKEKELGKKDLQIITLGKKLNTALATKVQELSKYRSEFFGRLRELVDKTGGIRVVGDRFVFQSEVLFEKGSAEIEPKGQEQLARIGVTLSNIAQQIPKEIDWVLRIDGHTDSDPISTALFPSNWELSTARAISVVKHLIDAGIPPSRLVAAGFGEHSRLDTRQDEIAKRRNRRIELKLTQR